MERAIWVYLDDTTRRYMETASLLLMVMSCAASWLTSDYNQTEKSSTTSPSRN